MNTSGPWMKYTWNAENRLVAVEPGNPTDGDRKVVFAYDYRGRRVRKQVYVYASTPTPGWTPEVIEERRFVWHDWLMLEELSGGTGSVGGPGEPTGAPAENEPVRQYTWGLDLAGLNGGVNSLQTAGGIGGLLAVHQAAIDRDGIDDDVVEGNYLYTHDGNGNVTQVIDNQDYTGGTPVTLGWFSQRLAARYEYDAYGNQLDIDTNGDGVITAADNPGFYVTENPFRFSTKYFDNETGLGYWGYRYYSPKMGRWINRDPIEEMGGIGLYVYAMSSPVVRIDPVGWLSYIDGPCGGAPGTSSYVMLCRSRATNSPSHPQHKKDPTCIPHR